MTFAECYPASAGGKSIDRFSPEALAEFPYEAELKLKDQALRSFLKGEGIPVPSPIVPSPVSRKYRSTGKRRISCRRSEVFLHLGRIPGREKVAPSLLEPEENLQLYRLIQQQLALPRNREAAESANYCIVRGGGEEKALILNVRHLSGSIIRSMRAIAELAAKEIPAVKSAFLYVDESGSDYYLEAERPAGKMGWKKLFGPEKLALRLAAPEPVKFLYPPTVFSQINESILPLFAGALKRELNLQRDDRLIDLYCGYGLWSLLLAPEIGSVWGAEYSMEAVQGARANARYHFPEKSMHFEAASIDRDFLSRSAPAPAGEKELILLDPPRKGTLPGVIEKIIARRPRRIAHVFCGADEVLPALKLYCANSCKVEKILPFDFFPGTLNVENLAIIRPPERP